MILTEDEDLIDQIQRSIKSVR